MTKPSENFTTRYNNAKKYRDAQRDELEEILSFISPGRENDLFDRQQNPSDEPDRETYMSLPEDLATDFASDLVTYFTPAESKWTDYEVTVEVAKEAVKAIKSIVEAREGEIEDLINSSNYNDVAPQIMFEANHGTPAMWVDAGFASRPIHIDPVPPHELLIAPGLFGLLDRFREKYVAAQHLAALLKDYDVDLTDPGLQQKMKKPGQTCKCCWGFWLDWSDPGNPLWRMEITVDNKRVTPEEPLVLGPMVGACPLHVGRFNPQIGKPWGRGPAYKALPDMRVLNVLDERVLEGMDQALSNTILYADDGYLDLENGLEPGNAYGIRGFDSSKIYEMNRGVNFDVGFMSVEQREERLRACFYQDGPRQTGDTPPTATQWVDERRRIQQRIGKPSAPLWTEFFLPFIQRVEYLGVQMGRFDAELTHDQAVIAVKPVSPLQKAQNQDKVLVTRSNLGMAAEAFQEALPNVIDLQGTMQNIIDASGDELIVVNTEPPSETTPPTA